MDIPVVLEHINAYRREHQAPPLVWNELLAKEASVWAGKGVLGYSQDPDCGESVCKIWSCKTY